MHQDPFPQSGEDDQEPALLGPDGDIGPEQGLFLSLPGENFNPDQFAQSGPAADMAPGAMLGTIMEVAVGEDGSGLKGMSYDQLIGMVAAARREQSRFTWCELAAMHEIAARAADQGPRGTFAADELAYELNVSWQSAAGQMHYATEVAERLPQLFAALAGGLIDAFKLRIIAEETRILSAEDAAKADAELAEAAASLGYGKLRSATQRLVLKLDPDSTRRRKEGARRATSVRRFREESGNAGMVARELPSAEATASWQHLEQRALDLRAAGVPGTMDELLARAYLDLLQERDSRAALAIQDGTATTDQETDGAATPSAAAAQSAPANPPGQDPGPSLAALVHITVPSSAYEDQSADPADIDGFGLVDNEDTRDLLAAAARHPRTRWCVTTLNPDGTAAAHACISGRHPPPPSGPSPDWLRHYRIKMTPITRGQCPHDHAETGYRPSRNLQHLVKARNARCTARGWDA